MKHVLIKIVNHLESELICYQDLSRTYDEQKDVLIKNKHAELQEIDNRFTTLYNKINKLNEVRKKLFNELKPGTNKLSEVIEIAKTEESLHIEKLEKYKETFNKLKTELEKKRYINFELLKNGVTITDKKLGIIIEAITPQGSSYNRKGKGKNIKKELPVSTINREA